MRRLASLLLFSILTATAACSQSPSPATPAQGTPRPNLYACEGCEAVYDHPEGDLDWQLTIPPEDEPGEVLVLTGRVFKPDETTPAPGVILYVHHTNAEGLYPQRGGEAGWGRRHGYLHGWLKTDAGGRYRITTIRPAPYPNASLPAHIHLYVGEPERRPYYIDDVVFEDDPWVTDRYRDAAENRGGSGIIALMLDDDDTWRGTHDIVLEW
ncbi:MAG: intradiol ring-cleavage dioxygenase [Rhodothermaceae bacterium]|nr:intradiol ring-cleavage dioxygenase [Rhodothermaceae bacterium]